MDYEDMPFQPKNSEKLYKFFAIYIDEYHDGLDNTPVMSDCLNGVFCDNDWRLHQFIKFYEPYYKKSEYHVEEYGPCTFSEFQDISFKKNRYKFDYSDYVLSTYLDVIGLDIYATERMIERMEEADSECDVIQEVFADYFYGAWTFLKYKGGYINSDVEGYEDIMNLINKVCRVYMPIIILLAESCDFNDFRGDWFLSLPDEVKVAFTKEADFPSLIEELDYTSMTDYDYIFYYFMIYCCDYPGKLAYTEFDDDPPAETTEDKQKLIEKYTRFSSEEVG